MKRSGIAYFIVWMFLLTGVIFGQNSTKYIAIEEGVSYKEIVVQRGNNFAIRLPGGGWYLNRYERESLSLITRVTEPLYTEFLIHPYQEGQSYLFFSYMKKDVYVLVYVLPAESPEQPTTRELPAPERPAPEWPVPELGTEASLEPSPPYLQGEAMEVFKEEPELESTVDQPQVSQVPSHMSFESEKTELPQDTQRIQETKGIKSAEEIKERELYYIDGNNKRVDIPYKDENDTFQKGLGLSKRGMLSQAVENLEQYLSECKKCVHLDETHFRLAGLYMSLGEVENVMKNLDILVAGEDDEYKKEAHLFRAELYSREGRMQDAVSDYKRVLELEPSNSDVIKKVGDIYFQLKDYENALHMYEIGRGVGVESDEIFFRMAIICDSPGKLRDLEKAYEYYKLVIDRYQKSEHYSYAKKRVDFLEKNFYHFK